MKKQANERTFQGILFKVISEIITENQELNFAQITQEENIGVGKIQRFADGLLYSALDNSKKILFELKNSKWEATEDELVEAALLKANNAGFEFFVTGTPRQLAIYKTFEQGKTLQECRIEIFSISKIRKDDEVKSERYKTIIKSALRNFLKKLSDIIHGVKTIVYDTINNLYINRLYAYISEATENMTDLMFDKINSDTHFKNRLKDYLRNQDIFNLTQSFDNEDVFKLCQLANYILYLKILFYSNLQRNVPALKLRPLIIPDDKKLLNSTLQNRFAVVLEHDYEMIFTPSVIDEFEFQNNYLPELRNNVENIKTLDFNDLNADIIGSIYNTLLDNQEQHDRGQHFTNTNEVDIINAFCINQDTKYVIDTSCGAGTFLVRAYQFLKFYQPDLLHEQLLEKVWGIEIATFPAFLSVMNLCLLSIRTTDNYPLIIRSDFAKITTDNKKLPAYDACVGNPPYIRQELIENKEEWNTLIKNEHGIKKLNQQSDFYVLYLMHTASFLKDGGRLGYVIASSWLDVSFGRDLQKFLLDTFKIIAIVDNQAKRSFETASINSVILILEKCSNAKERQTNHVKFVRIFKDYETLIGNTWQAGRIEKVNNFVQTIEKANKNSENSKYKLFIINQKELESESTIENKYQNGHWGAKYLRSPKIYGKIIEKVGEKLVKTSSVVDVKRGFTTGANDFFYVEEKTGELKESYWDEVGWFYSDLTKQHHKIERCFVKPLFKTQKEAEKLDVNIGKLSNYVVFCSEDKTSLRKSKYKILDYIKEAEKLNIQNRPTLTGREVWYNLSSSATIGDFIFPSKIGEKFRLIDNREAQVFCDKVNYIIEVKSEFSDKKDIVFLILNSTFFRFYIDLFSRQLTGAQTLSDVDVNVVENSFIINPLLLVPYESELEKIYKSLKSREQGTIFEEVKQADRRRLDEIVFEVLGLEKTDVDELYTATCNYVANRKQKSESVTTTKQKQKFSFDEAVLFIKERFPEIRTYNSLIKKLKTDKYKIPAWNAKFSKPTNGTPNMFQFYQVFFVEDNQQEVINFANDAQVELFRFLHTTFDIKDGELMLPVDEMECKAVWQTLKSDFEKYGEQVNSQLKKHRISINYKIIYKEILSILYNQ